MRIKKICKDKDLKCMKVVRTTTTFHFSSLQNCKLCNLKHMKERWDDKCRNLKSCQFDICGLQKLITGCGDQYMCCGLMWAHQALF